MTPTIDQIEAALPYVPAGLHCGDLTEPDERRAFAEVIHGIVVAAMRCELCGDQRILNFGDCPPCPACSETAPESRQAVVANPSAPAPQNGPETPHRRNNGVSSWGTRYPPDWLPDDYDPASVEVQHGDTWEYRNGAATIVARNAWPPPKPDMSIAWGITEALIEDRGR